MKLLEFSKKQISFDLKLEENLRPKTPNIKKKNNKLDYIKIIDLFSSKDTSYR